jgi:hypothetical protein
MCLALSLAFGTVVVPEAWATDYYVNTSGNNGNAGTSAGAPWKTLTHALAQSYSPGDVIHVAPGTYDNPGNTETFPLSLVDGVAILGDTANPASTIVSAPAGTDDFFVNGSALSASTRLAGFTLTHDASAANEKLIDVLMPASATQAPQIDHNRFLADGTSTDMGIFIGDVAGTGAFTGLIEDNEFDVGHAPLQAVLTHTGLKTVSPTVSNNTFSGADQPISLTAYSSAQGTIAPTITGNHTTGTKFYDLYWLVEASKDGLHFSPTVSGNSFSGTTSAYGVYLSASGSIGAADTMTIEPMITNNTFTGHNQGAYFSFYRHFGVGTLNATITLEDNTFTDVDYGAQFWQDKISDAITAHETINMNGNRFVGGTNQALLVDVANIAGASAFDATFNVEGNFIEQNADGAPDAILANMNTSYGGLLGDPGDAVHVNVIGNLVYGGDPNNAADTSFAAGISMAAVNGDDLGTFDATIRGNTITSTGGPDSLKLSFTSMQSVGSSKVDISDNYVNANALEGLHLQWYDETASATDPITLRCNTFTENVARGVVLSLGKGKEPDFGTSGDHGLNSFSGNDSASSPAIQFYTNDSSPVSAEGNWWGTTSNIDDVIRDDNESAGVGAVDFANYLTAAPVTTVARNMTLTNVNDVAPPGNSPGDTLRVTSVLDASGTCTGAFYFYTGPIPANSTYVQGSLTTTSGFKIEPLPGTGDPVYVQGIEIPPNGTATITYDVVVNGGPTLTTDGTVQSGNIGTQPVGPASVDIATAAVPALGQLGLLLLALLVALTSMWALRRRRGRWAAS